MGLERFTTLARSPGSCPPCFDRQCSPRNRRVNQNRLQEDSGASSAHLYLCRLSQLERRHKYNPHPQSIGLASVLERAHSCLHSSTEEGQAKWPSQSQGLLPVGFIAEADRSNRTRLSLGAHGPDRRTPMTRSNSSNETNNPKTTTVSTSSHPVERGTNSEPSANSQSAAANTKQVPVNEFEFVRASRLRENALDHEGDDRGGDR